jgi:hypothetical protein
MNIDNNKSTTAALLEFSLVDGTSNIVTTKYRCVDCIQKFINTALSGRKVLPCIIISISIILASFVIFFVTVSKHGNSHVHTVLPSKQCQNLINKKLEILESFRNTTVSFMDLTFPGTHNSAINLSPKLSNMPKDTELSRKHPSVAQQPFYYAVLNQRISVFDQLQQGVRYFSFETVIIPDENKCPINDADTASCTCKYDSVNYCFKCCNMLVTHGNFHEAYNLNLGYTFLHDLFIEIRNWIEKKYDEKCNDDNTDQIIWIYLDSWTLHSKIEKEKYYGLVRNILAESGLLHYVYNLPTPKRTNSNNDNTRITKNKYSNDKKRFLVWDMIKSKKNVVLSFLTSEHEDVTAGHVNNIRISSNYFVTKDKSKVSKQCFIPKLPCHVGWDSHDVKDMSASRIAILNNNNGSNHNVSYHAFAMYHMTSSRTNSAPYIAGGNPYEAMLIRNKSLILNKLLRYKNIYNQHVNVVIVDFFNTKVTSKSKPLNMKLLKAVDDNDDGRQKYFDAVTEAVCKFNDINLKGAIKNSKYSIINVSYVVGC